MVPAQAEATLSLRLAPGQDPQRMLARSTGLLRAALPPGAELELHEHARDARRCSIPDSPR